ncbi:MAG: methyl-accepting chemotaxis protein [Treponema sp.]|nr:methyl-accepting chemotaxis protein [Treponema sp.]
MKIGLQQKLYLMLLLPLILILIVIAGIASVTTSKSTNGLIESSARSMAKNTAHTIDIIFDNYKMRSQQLARESRISSMVWEWAKEAFQEEKTYDTNLESTLLIEPSGKTMTLEGQQAQVNDSDYYQDIFYLNKAVTISNAIISKTSGNPVIVVAAAIKDRGRDKANGAVGLVLSLQSLARYFSSETGLNGIAMLVDNKGTVVYHPDSQIRMKLNLLKADEAGYRGLQTLAQTMLEGKEGSGTYKGPDSNQYHAFWAPLSAVQDWSYLVAIPEADFIRPVQATILVVVLSFIGLALIIALLIYFIGHIISKPVRETRNAIEDLARGEGDLTRRLTIITNDELGEMGNNLNQFLDLIHSIVGSVRNIVDQMRLLGDELQANTTEAASSAKQISGNTEDIKDRLVSQSAGVSETLATVEQINRNIKSFLQMIETQATNLTEASSAIEEMVANINAVAQTAIRNYENIMTLGKDSDAGKELLNNVESLIQNIDQASEGMLEANTIIANIASQTNLLSMNAAIEAAHAGDAGKGFAVVAEEIRKLAENANEQSKTITQVLHNVKSLIDEAVSSTAEAQKKFDNVFEGIRKVGNQEIEIKNAMEEQQQGSQQVLVAMKELNQITAEIRSGSEEIRIGSQSILDEMSRVMKGTQEIEQASQENAQGSLEIVQAMEHISNLSTSNAQSIKELESLVVKFKI